MGYSEAMQKHKAVGYSLESLLYFYLAKSSVLTQLLKSAWKVLQNKIPIAIRYKVVIVGDNILMLNALIKLVLVLFLSILSNDLYRHQPIGKNVLGFVNLARQSFSYSFKNLISLFQQHFLLDLWLHLQAGFYGWAAFDGASPTMVIRCYCCVKLSLNLFCCFLLCWTECLLASLFDLFDGLIGHLLYFLVIQISSSSFSLLHAIATLVLVDKKINSILDIFFCQNLVAGVFLSSLIHRLDSLHSFNLEANLVLKIDLVLRLFLQVWLCQTFSCQ